MIPEKSQSSIHISLLDYGNSLNRTNCPFFVLLLVAAFTSVLRPSELPVLLLLPLVDCWRPYVVGTNLQASVIRRPVPLHSHGVLLLLLRGVLGGIRRHRLEAGIVVDARGIGGRAQNVDVTIWKKDQLSIRFDYCIPSF